MEQPIILTTQQKIEGYEHALNLIQREEQNYICIGLYLYLQSKLGIYLKFSSLVATDIFTELLIYRKGNITWFDSKEQRIDVLQNIIKKLKQTL